MSFSLRNPQLAKELRHLRLPWIGAVAAGSLLAVRPLVEGEGLETLLMAIVLYGFFGGLALVAVVSFGGEFQEHTWALLLTQPVPRSQLWKKKLLLVIIAVVAALLVEGLVLATVSSWYSGSELWDALLRTFSVQGLGLAAVFILATVCSCGYWTLVAGSIIGGLVFTIAIQVITAELVALVWARVSNNPEPFGNSGLFPVLIIAGAIYSMLFLWLGRRKFLNYEVRATRFSESALRENGLQTKIAAWFGLVSTPGNKFLNFARKELMLLTPAVQLAAFFTISWLVVLVIQWQQHLAYLFDIFTCLYAPITCLLAGCLSLGEEKVLGIDEAQLTLPLSPTLQWLLKLVVGAFGAALLSLGLPLLLFWGTGLVVDLSQSGLVGQNDNGKWQLVCICGLAFILSFWAAAHVANTVRAAITTVVGIILVAACVALGVWWGESWARNAGGFLAAPLLNLMCHFQLSPSSLMAGLNHGPELALGLVGLIVVVMLYQGLRRFRRRSQGAMSLGMDALLVAALITTGVFLLTDYRNVLQSLPDSAPVAELRNALNAIATRDADLKPTPSRDISTQELEGRMGTQTKLWLKGAKIILVRRNDSPGNSVYEARITFPNGSTFEFGGTFVLNRKKSGRIPVW